MNTQMKMNPINKSLKISGEQQKILKTITKTEDHTIFLGLLKLKIQGSMDDLIDDLKILEAREFISIDSPSVLIKESPDLLCRFRLTKTGKKILIEYLNEYFQNHGN